MKTLPITASEEQVKQWVRDWVALLGEERYDEAVAMLHPNTSRYGQCDGDNWTGEYLRTILSHYGLDEPIPEDPWIYKPIPVTEELHEEFERKFSAELRDPNDPDDPDWKRDGMDIHVDMPLLHESGAFVSDVTARLILRRVGENEIGIELFDAHVM